MSRVERIGDATKWTAIYALCEEPSVRPRYVGKTTQWLHNRHKAHIRAARRGEKLPVHYWLRKQMAAGAFLGIKLLEYVQPGGNWKERERHWIERLRAEGAHLLNLTAGGEGLPGHNFSQEHRHKIAAALRTGGHFECGTCGASFWRKRHEIAMGHNRFCSRRCSNNRNRGPELSL